MFRTNNLMVEKEREIDYLCRLEKTFLPTERSSKEVVQLLVDFILRHKLNLNGQTGRKYTNFREPNADFPFIGGFGSRHQIARIIVDNDFDIKKHAEAIKEHIVKLYARLDFTIQLQEECVTFSLKENYTTLEDVEYIEIIYNAYLETDTCSYPQSMVLVRHYLHEDKYEFSMVDREDIDMDIIITLTTSMNSFNDILPVFIENNKHIFCKKLGIDIEGFNADTITLIQMLDI
jgi:hypothetical protein